MADETMLQTFRGYMDANGLERWALNAGDGKADAWDAEDRSITVAKDASVVGSMHTLAHALVGSDEHSPRWRAVAISLGVDPDAVHPEDESDPDQDEPPSDDEQQHDVDPGEIELEDEDETAAGAAPAAEPDEDPSEGKGIVPPFMEPDDESGKPEPGQVPEPSEYPIVGHCPEGCTLERKRMPRKQIYCKPHDLPVEFTRV